MPEGKKQVIDMEIDREVKNSVLYKPAGDIAAPILQNIYLMRNFAEKVGLPRSAMPARIRVTVEIIE